MDADRVIAEVAKRNGVLLHRDDPILQIHTMLELHANDQREFGGVTDAQVVELGRMLQQGFNASAANVVTSMNRQSRAIMLAVVLGAVLAGGALSWLAFGAPLHPACVTVVGGGRICGAWVTE